MPKFFQSSTNKKIDVLANLKHAEMITNVYFATMDKNHDEIIERVNMFLDNIKKYMPVGSSKVEKETTHHLMLEFNRIDALINSFFNGCIDPKIHDGVEHAYLTKVKHEISLVIPSYQIICKASAEFLIKLSQAVNVMKDNKNQTNINALRNIVKTETVKTETEYTRCTIV